MSPYDLLVAVVALLGAVALGTIVHELLHAAVLRASGVPCSIQWLGDDGDGLAAGSSGALASVRPLAIPPSLSAWQLRAAALSPFLLAVVLVPIALGAVPDPFRGGHLAVQLAVIGWLACALPSPRDFSLVWHARAVLDDPEQFLDTEH